MKSGIVAIAALVLLAGCNNGPAAPELTLQQFMKQKVDPTSAIYFASVSSTSELIDGKVVNTETAPETDADWEKVRQAAADLRAQAELLQSDAYTEGRRDDWTRMAKDLATVSTQAEQAAKDKDPEKVFEVSGTIYMVCDGCHTAYPADASQAGGGSAS